MYQENKDEFVNLSGSSVPMPEIPDSVKNLAPYLASTLGYFFSELAYLNHLDSIADCGIVNKDTLDAA